MTSRAALVVTLLACVSFVIPAVWAADASIILKEGNSGDAVCTRCHGVDEQKPILSIHRTRHGVASQPGCQACHGSSRAHVRHRDDDSARPAPEMLKAVVRANQNHAGIYGAVTRIGRLAVGQAVLLGP